MDHNVLETTLLEMKRRIQLLEERIYWQDTLFSKAFRVAGFGDFLEFGVFRGGTLSQAFWCAVRLRDEWERGMWSHSEGAGGTQRRDAVLRQFREMRFIGINSFEGIPTPTGPDAERQVFEASSYAATEEVARDTLTRENVDQSQIILVKGYFEQVCTHETAERLGLKHIAVVHIDSDLYSSAKIALHFCEPYFRDGSVVIFDEWFQFSGHPDFGEQRAFSEFLAEFPRWHAAELAREGFGRVAFVLNRVT